MTQIEKIIVRLYRDGYIGETIARAVGEDRSYVEFVLDSYFGRGRSERSAAGTAIAIGTND